MNEVKIGVNLGSAIFKESIVKIVNSSDLPYVNKRYVLSEVLSDLRRLEEEKIKLEVDEYKKMLDSNKKEEVV